MPTRNEEISFTVDRLRNFQNSAEGPSLPPLQRRSPSRVPIASQLKVAQTKTYFGGTEFTLTWEAPERGELIGGYNIYIAGLFGNAEQPMGPYSCPGSPATLRVTGQTAQRVRFAVQTVLKNGMVSALDLSPTCTGKTIDPTLDGSEVSAISLDKLPAGADKSIVAGTGLSSPPTYQTRASLDLALGSASLTTEGRLPFVAAAGTLGQCSGAFWDHDNSRLGLGTDIPKSLLHVAGSAAFKHDAKDADFAAAEAVLYLCDATAGNIAASLPAVANAPNRLYIFVKVDAGANTVTVTPDGAEVINGAGATISAQWGVCAAMEAGGAWYIIFKI